MSKRIVASRVCALALAISAGIAAAQSAPEPTYGPGQGYGPGYGRGGGMMGGGPGWGPGMGGPGWGPGMGGYYGGDARGWGPGWQRGGGGPLAALDLTDDQQQKIARIQEDQRAKNWNTMGQIRAEQFKLRQMYYGDKVDANAIVEQQKKVDDLRRGLIKSRVETRNQIDALLTKEQRQQFRSFGPWWENEAY